jgi:hypothetical protein
MAQVSSPDEPVARRRLRAADVRGHHQEAVQRADGVVEEVLPGQREV